MTRTKPIIGILGGIGPESSALFYQEIIRLVQSNNIKSNTEYPHIIIDSIPGPELLLKNPDLTMYKVGLQNLQKAGADFIVIICNTAYTFINQLKREVTVPIIDLNLETETILKEKNIDNITIIGSNRTTRDLFNFKNVEITSLTDKELKMVDNIIIKYNSGINKKEQEKAFINLIKNYSANNILIACTELSLIAKNNKLKCLDTFDILLNSTLKWWRNYKK